MPTRSQADTVRQAIRLLSSASQLKISPTVDRQTNAVQQSTGLLFPDSQPSNNFHTSRQTSVLCRDLAHSTGAPNSQCNSVLPADSSTPLCSSQANFHAQNLLRSWSQSLSAPVIYRHASLSWQATRQLSITLDRHASRSSQPAKHMSTAAPERRPDFAQLQQSDLDFFKQTLGGSAVVTDPHALEPLNTYVFSSYILGRPLQIHTAGVGVLLFLCHAGGQLCNSALNVRRLSPLHLHVLYATHDSEDDLLTKCAACCMYIALGWMAYLILRSRAPSLCYPYCGPATIAADWCQCLAPQGSPPPSIHELWAAS